MGISVNSRSSGARRTRTRESSLLMDVDDRLPTKYPTRYLAIVLPIHDRCVCGAGSHAQWSEAISERSRVDQAAHRPCRLRESLRLDGLVLALLRLGGHRRGLAVETDRGCLPPRSPPSGTPDGAGCRCYVPTMNCRGE